MLNHKRIMSLVLAGAMAASLAVPAFAAETTEEKNEKNETKITATYEAVKIDVTVPTTGTAVINPYALPVQIGTADGTESGTAVKMENAQIVTKALALRNKTDIDLNVSATVTTAITDGSDMTLSTTALTSTDTAKKAFVFLETQPSAITGDDDAVTAGLATGYKSASWTDPTKFSDTATNAVALSSAKAVTKSNIGTLAKATMDNDGAFSAYAAGSVLYIRLNGNVVQSPKTAWAATDGFTSTIAFTFTPKVSA
jgi:hypothetical protein